MTYSKPRIVNAGPAAAAIQGTKPLGAFADSIPPKSHTVAAYEADE